MSTLPDTPEEKHLKEFLIGTDLPLMVRQAHGSTGSPRTEDQAFIQLKSVRPELVEG